MIRWFANPLCLFLGVWGVAVVLYLGGVFLGTFPSPQSLTIVAVLLNLGVFPLGYLTGSLFRDLAPTVKAPLLPSQPCTPQRLARALQGTLLMGLAALLLELYRVALLASYFHIHWLYLVTHPTVLRLCLIRFTDATLFQASAVVMLLSLAHSFFSIGFILLGVSLHVDRTRWKYVYLAAFLLIALATGVLHVSRYEVTASVLSLVFVYCLLHPARARATSYLKLAVPMAAIALLFLAIDLLLHKSATYASASPLQGFLFQLYWYLASPIAAFNEFLTTFAGDHTPGQNTFFPLYKWLCRFHLAQPTEVSIYGEKVYLPYLANVYTYLRNFYEDFGLWGVVLAPYVLGWSTALIQPKALRYIHYLNLYVILLTFILFSFYNYFLFPTQIYLQILFGFVFFRYEMKNSDGLEA